MLQIKNNTKLKGMSLAIAGPLLWGFSGIVAQFLFTTYQLSPKWLVCVRMFGAGLLLLIFGYGTIGRQIFNPWRQRATALKLVLFSFLGMLPAQLTYFMAIHYSNAATATVLQFLSPVLIILYLALTQWRLPRIADLIAIFCALSGTFLLVTGGHFNHLNISVLGLSWGLLTALSTAIYTLAPRRMLTEFGSVTIVGWAMLLGSFGMLPFVSQTPFAQTALNGLGWLAILFVIIFGTLFAYLFVLKSLEYVAPTVTSLLGAFEPLTSTILTVLFFHIAFGLSALIGTALIIATTLIQALVPAKK